MPPSTTGSSISDRARTGATVDPQESFFDQQIEDEGLEKLLDEREDRKAKLGTAKKNFNEKHDLVKARLSEFELADGEVARCGKYRIAKTPMAGGHRSFDVNPSSRLDISLFE